MKRPAFYVGAALACTLVLIAAQAVTLTIAWAVGYPLLGFVVMLLLVWRIAYLILEGMDA